MGKSPAYSKGTQELLEKMMADSKLTTHQQKELRRRMSTGDALPATGPRPTAYRRERSVESLAPQGPWQDPYRGVPINPMITRGMGRKPQQQIVTDSNGYARDSYAGGRPGVDREELKAKLQNKLQFGDEPMPPPRSATRPLADLAPKDARSELERMRDEIVEEVEERHAFIREMRALGHARHEQTVKGEIAERMRELKRVEALIAESKRGKQ